MLGCGTIFFSPRRLIYSDNYQTINLVREAARASTANSAKGRFFQPSLAFLFPGPFSSFRQK